MILIATKHNDLMKMLSKDLSGRGHRIKVVDTKESTFVAECYQADISTIITDEDADGMPAEAICDLCNALSHRTAVIVIRESADKILESAPLSHKFLDQVLFLGKDQYDEILSTALLCAGQAIDGLRSRVSAIPLYNADVPISMLKSYGGLGILTIDATGFNKISVDYGVDVYHVMKRVLHDVLFSLWGHDGCIRENDVLCRRSLISNNYLLFLNRSRDMGSLPFPGALERLADRVSSAINNGMWQELFAPRAKRRIPECVQSIPLIGVGFYGVLFNPCVEIHETLELGLEASKQMAQAQLKRGRERQRELMQTLIQADDFLMPHYQGVFYLQKVDQDMVNQALEEKSIGVFQSAIFGFESLIRVNKAEIEKYPDIEMGLDPKYLRPDVLFALANYTNVALELDQACMRQAAAGAAQLPGTLMVNILPRNLYHIDRLKLHFSKVERIMFEVSESEAINNLELMLRSREHLEKHSMGIAADDFGKGYSSLERIIKIRPDVIKFDRSMIQDIHKDPVKQAYVKGLVTAAKMLNTTILAEGVELWEEAEVLKAMNIELVQGYLFHRPQAAASIEEQLRQATEENERRNTKSNVA